MANDNQGKHEEAEDNGVLVLGKPDKGENTDSKFDIKGWNNNPDDEETEEKGKPGDIDLGAQKKVAVEKNGEPKVKVPGTDDGAGMNDDEDNVLKELAGTDDNDFSLDDDGGSETELEKEKSEQKDQKNDAADLIGRISKEFEIGDVQNPEQLIDLLKQRIVAAENGASAPTAGIDAVMKLPERELLKTWLVKEKGWEEKDAETYIEKNVDLYGEDWIGTQTPEILSSLKSYRKRIVDAHVKQQEAKAKIESHFSDGVKEEVLNLKTMFGIPLKPFIAELKEFQAMIKNPDGIAKMRNDPKFFTEAAFAAKFGKKILNKLLTSERTDGFRRGHKSSYKTNVEDKILNKGFSQRIATEVATRGTKEGTFDINRWNDPEDEG